MRKYLSFFRIRFSMGLQYRVAAAADVYKRQASMLVDILETDRTVNKELKMGFEVIRKNSTR